MGRKTGSRKVGLRSYTRYRKIPNGLVSSTTAPKKRNIWNQPLPVIIRISPVSKGRKADSHTTKALSRSVRRFLSWVHLFISGARSRADKGCSRQKRQECKSQKLGQ